MGRGGDEPEALQGLVRTCLLAPAAALAACTVLTHAAQGWGWPFACHAWACGAATLVAGVAAVGAVVRGPRPRLDGVAAALGVLAVLGGALAVLSHRPDADDTFYLPNAVWALAHPGAPMGWAVRFWDAGDGRPFVALSFAVAVAYEYTLAALAWVSGADFLTLYYVVAPLCSGGLVPLAWFYLLTRLRYGDRGAVAGAALVVLVLPLLGETHRSWGNLAFDRLFQGKAVFLSLLLPVLAAVTLDFLARRRVRDAAGVFAVATAGVGATASACILEALFVPVVWAAACFADGVALRRAVALGGGLAAALAYASGYALWLQRGTASGLAADSPAYLAYPKDFAGHFASVFDVHVPIALGVVALSLVIALRCPDRFRRRLVASWLALALLYLNPLTAPWLIRHVTTPTIYWRVFYLLPFPLALGVAGTRLSYQLGVGTTPRGNAIAATVAVALVGLHWVPGVPSVFRDGTTLAAPGYRLDVRALAAARDVAAVAPPGTMLAPAEVYRFVPLVSAEHPQLVHRDDPLRLWLFELGMPDEAERRRTAAAALSAVPGGDVGALRDLLARWQVASVVAHDGAVGRHDLRTLLAAGGFTHERRAGAWVVFTRPG